MKKTIIVVTAKNLPEDVKTGIDAGAYLTKLVAFKDLKQAVERWAGL